MSTFQQYPETGGQIPPYRLNVQLHDLLKKPTGRPLLPPPPSAKPLTLPEPVFPQHPELLTEEELEADKHGSATDPYKRRWTFPLVYRAMRGWLFPYVKSRLLPGDFHLIQNSLIIRVDGTLAPCYPMYSARHDWGVVDAHKLEAPQLNEMKKGCQRHCFSTLNHNLGYCYDATRALKWVFKQASRGFQGTSGSFED
jgi:hypothetical protein